MKRTRRNHGATFKAQVAVATVKGDKTPDLVYCDNLTTRCTVA